MSYYISLIYEKRVAFFNGTSNGRTELVPCIEHGDYKYSFTDVGNPKKYQRLSKAKEIADAINKAHPECNAKVLENTGLAGLRTDDLSPIVKLIPID